MLLPALSSGCQQAFQRASCFGWPWLCSSTGGMFNNYALVQGVDHIVPVDIYVPGCPPGPQSLMHGILTLHDKIMAGEINR